MSGREAMLWHHIRMAETSTPSASKRGLGSTLTFLGFLILAVGLFALVMVVMGTRLDNQDVAPPPASPAEVERQDLAESAVRIAELGNDLGADDASAQQAASHASAWSDAFGDIWVPWPAGAPSGYTNPPVATTASDRTPQGLISELDELSNTLVDGSTKLDRSLATSIAIAATLDARAIASQHGLEYQCGAPDFEILGSLGGDGVSVKRFETARQWLESHAATLEVGARDLEIERAENVATLIEEFIDAGAPDTRPAMVNAPISGENVSAAYHLIAQQFVFLSTHANSEQQAAIVNYLCSLTEYEDAPAFGAFPGINEADLLADDASPTGP